MSKVLDDPNIEIINKCVREIVPNARIILFGSRAKRLSDEHSDYDILVIVDSEMPRKKLWNISKKIRKSLAQHRIPVDAIIRTPNMVKKSAEYYWTIVSEALETGIEL